MRSNPVLGLLIAVGVWIGAPSASALQRGAPGSAADHVSGGVGHAEQQELLAQRGRHNLWITTAARGSGAHLAGVVIRITDAASARLMLEHTMDGPWLLATLPPGRYAIEATYRESPGGAGQTLIRRVSVPRQGLRQLILYFDTPEDVGPEREPAFPFNPYGGATPALREQGRHRHRSPG